MDLNGNTTMISRKKSGTIHDIKWNPNNSNEFLIIYGSNPPCATLYNTKLEVVFDFGNFPRNKIFWNPRFYLINNKWKNACSSR